MRCPHCGHDESRVLDTRDSEQGIRRRRECLRCENRFSTVEKAQAATLMVSKRGGGIEEFDREKLLKGIRLACTRRPMPAGTVDKIVDDVEEDLLRRGRIEVTSTLIGELSMDHLRQVDRVAYIRFASVYRDFADEDDFRRAVEGLHRDGETAAGQLSLLPPDQPNKSGRRGRPAKR
jgi:transcriptional repressor NrdR